LKMPFKGLFGGKKSRLGSGGLEIEDYFNEMTVRDGKIVEDDSATYVKSVRLESDGGGVDNALAEIEKGNLVILNVRALLPNRTLLMQIVHEIRDTCLDVDGDIARVSEDKILIVPNGFRIASGGETPRE